MNPNIQDQELKDRLSLIESMIAEGRRTTESWGWTFVFWGVAYYVAIAWAANLEVESMTPVERDTIEYLTRTITARTEPMRQTMSPADRNDAKAVLFRRLDWVGAEPSALSKEIFEKYSRVIESEDALEMIRGGDEWLLLHRYDLLVCLSPWIIEVEEVDEVEEDAKEGAARVLQPVETDRMDRSL